MEKTISVDKLMNKKSPMKSSWSRILFNVFNYLLIAVLSFLFLYPYWNVFVKAINAPVDTALGGLYFWPRQFTLTNITQLLMTRDILYGFRNTIFRVVLGTVFAIIITYMAAYALTKKGLRFKKAIYTFLMLPMFLSGGLIATYVIYAKLGLTNNLFVYILPFGFSFYNMVVMRTFLIGIPESLGEAARIDGANEFRILFGIMLPLSKPVIATVALWVAVFHWNDWTTTLYYANLKWENYTLQYNLMQILKESERAAELIAQAESSGQNIGDPSLLLTPESVEAAQIIVSTLPIIILYPFIQKFFVQGVMIGSVKE